MRLFPYLRGVVLSHNLLAVLFGIAFISAVICRLVGAVPNWVVARCGVMASVSFLTYGLYLRTLMQGW